MVPGSGRSPREWNGYPLQYSCLENSMDRGAWQATVHRVAQSRTRLSDRHTCSPQKGKSKKVSCRRWCGRAGRLVQCCRGWVSRAVVLEGLGRCQPHTCTLLPLNRPFVQHSHFEECLPQKMFPNTRSDLSPGWFIAAPFGRTEAGNCPTCPSLWGTG